MGYVGASLSAALADGGIRVYGIDIDTDLVNKINN